MLGLLATKPVSMIPINGWFCWGRLGVISGWVSVSVIVYSLMVVSESLSVAVAMKESAMIFCEWSG